MLLDEYKTIEYSEKFVTKLNNECENKLDDLHKNGNGWTTYNVRWYHCAMYWDGPSGHPYTCDTCKKNILYYNNKHYVNNINYELLINTIDMLTDKVKVLEEKIEVLENNIIS